MQHILIIGSGSAIAQAVARRYASEGNHLFLFARKEEVLIEQKADLLVRGAAGVEYATLDLSDTAQQKQAVGALKAAMPEIDIVLICHGTLPDQKACEENPELAIEAINLNALSTISLLGQLVPLLKIQQSGCIAVITSVAGDRGRPSNYVYGAAKGMLTRYLQGLRASLFRDGIHVLEIRPGFVDTPMTRHFRKGILWASPEQVAAAIIRGIARRRNILYTPWFWRPIMWVIRSIPEALFKRLSM